MADLDGLARVNRELGHAAGDEALRAVAAALAAVKRSFDSAARVGGEEFALLAPDCDEHGAYMIAERVRLDVAATSAAAGQGLTISFGVATFPGARELGRDAAAGGRPGAPGGQGARPRPHGDLERRGVRRPRTPTRRGRAEPRVGLAALLEHRRGPGRARHRAAPSHCHRVGRFAELTARELGLPPDTVERVRLAGMLHDVGRIGIPDEVARKRGPL